MALTKLNNNSLHAITDGSALKNVTGAIVQHVRKSITNNGTTHTGDTSFTNVANWNINITPKSSSNILLVRTMLSCQVSGSESFYGRYRFYNTTDNASFHDNIYCGQSHYNQDANNWVELPLMAVTNGACGFNTQKTIQLQFALNSSSAQWSNAWSGGDNRILEIMEIAA